MPKKEDKAFDPMVLNGNLVGADFFVGFEGAFVAGEDDNLSLLSKLVQYLD